MKLLDDSPGGFTIAANAFVYGVAGIEILMLISGSILAMVAVLALIVALVMVLVHGMSQLMGPEAYTTGHEVTATTVAEADQARPAVERRTAPTGRPALS